MKRVFRVTAVVRSLNKPATAVYVGVEAEDEQDAQKQAKNKIQKQNPGASVQIGRVRS